MWIRRRVHDSSGSAEARRRLRAVAVAAAAMVVVAGCGGTETSDATAHGSTASSTGSSPVAGASSSAAPAVAATTAPVVTSRIDRRHERIPFATRTVESDALPRGAVQVEQTGHAGTRVKLYRVTLRDGVVQGRRLIRTVVRRQPIARVVVHGTHVEPPKPVAATRECDSNYSGGCVPVASDVDCAGGSGNGPAYVSGTVRVTGADIYDLDRDGDGYGCD